VSCIFVQQSTEVVLATLAAHTENDPANQYLVDYKSHWPLCMDYLMPELQIFGTDTVLARHAPDK
jgi:hypothetical protein